MPIPRPVSCVHVPDKNAELVTFPKDEDAWDSAYYRFCGGICWPVPVSRVLGVKVSGFVCVVGEDVEARKYTVFEQRSFVTLEHLFGAGKVIRFEGIADWFNRMWAQYRCRKYYVHQDDDTMGRFMLNVGRSETIDPKPWLEDCVWFDQQTALRVVWELIATGRLKHRKEEQINAERLAAKEGDKLLETSPALHAISVCLSGMEHSPWRKPQPFAEEPVEDWKPC